jgi:hypothetical protein
MHDKSGVYIPAATNAPQADSMQLKAPHNTALALTGSHSQALSPSLHSVDFVTALAIHPVAHEFTIAVRLLSRLLTWSGEGAAVITAKGYRSKTGVGDGSTGIRTAEAACINTDAIKQVARLAGVANRAIASVGSKRPSYRRMS